MESVWLIWTATKSSYRLRAPGAKVGSIWDGLVSKHWTALIYALRSLLERKFLQDESQLPNRLHIHHLCRRQKPNIPILADPSIEDITAPLRRPLRRIQLLQCLVIQQVQELNGIRSRVLSGDTTGQKAKRGCDEGSKEHCNGELACRIATWNRLEGATALMI